MNIKSKCQQFALSQYLSNWPENWTYQRVIDELNNGNNEYAVSEWDLIQGIPPEDLAQIIGDCAEYAAFHFFDSSLKKLQMQED